MITPVPLVSVFFLALLVAIAAFCDLRTRRIPNWLTLSGLLIGIGINSFLFEWKGLRMSLLGMLAGFGAYFVLYLLRAMGAGDVKLMAAVGALVGPGNWFAIFLITAFLGGVTGLLALLWRKRIRQGLSNVAFIVSELMRFRPAHLSREELDVRSPNAMKMPHGAVIAAGCAVFLAISLHAMA